MNTDTFRHTIRHYMVEHGLTQENLGHLAQVSQSSISRFLNGREIKIGPALRLLEHMGCLSSPSCHASGGKQKKAHRKHDSPEMETSIQ